MMKNTDDDEKARTTLIDESLKRIYDDISSEEIPDRFKDLLSQLKAKESGVNDSK